MCFPRPLFALIPLVAIVFETQAAEYSRVASSFDSGGASASAGIFSNSSSIGTTGVFGNIADEKSNQAGYLSQIHEPEDLELAAGDGVIIEEETLQVDAMVVLEDGTRSFVDPERVTWTVLSGPLVGVDIYGLVTALPVSAHTAAMIDGSYETFYDSIELTVLDDQADTFGSYSGDGLGDAWQVQYFGLDNPLAGPGVDADGDGQDNQFEFTALVDPTDPGSRFLVEAARTGGQPQIIFSPVRPGKSYSVEYAPSLHAPDWFPLSGGSILDSGNERTVTDNSPATGESRFYRVHIQ